MRIIEYDEKYKQDFINLNKAWIEKYFIMEENDYYIFDHVEDLLKNGMIFFLLDDDNSVVASCLIEYLGDDIYEFAKLGARGFGGNHGAGEKLVRHSIEYIKNRGGKKIKILSNTILEQAIYIYKKVGFVEVPLKESDMIYDRVDIVLEYTI